MKRPSVAAFLTACLLLLPAGCGKEQIPSGGGGADSRPTSGPGATPEKGVKGTHEVVTETAYYLGGPQQSRPPEGKLPAGTRVTLLESSGSYSAVEIFGIEEGSFQAYVSTDALKKSP